MPTSCILVLQCIFLDGSSDYSFTVRSKPKETNHQFLDLNTYHNLMLLWVVNKNLIESKVFQPILRSPSTDNLRRFEHRKQHQSVCGFVYQAMELFHKLHSIWSATRLLFQQFHSQTNSWWEYVSRNFHQTKWR